MKNTERQTQLSETKSIPLLPILHDPPEGLNIKSPLVVVVEAENYAPMTGSTADIWLGDWKEKKVVVKVARDNTKIEFIKNEHEFLTQKLPQSVFDRMRGKKQKDIHSIAIKSKLSEYGIKGIFSDYTIKTRLVNLEKDAISGSMLKHGQIVQEFVDGQSLRNRNGTLNKNIPSEIHFAIILNYLKYSQKLIETTGEVLDFNFDTDILTKIDHNLKHIETIRIDAFASKKVLEDTASFFVAQEITSLYNNKHMSPEDISFLAKLSPNFKNVSKKFEKLANAKKTFSKLFELSLEKPIYQQD